MPNKIEMTPNKIEMQDADDFGPIAGYVKPKMPDLKAPPSPEKIRATGGLGARVAWAEI